jgi:hypothetical protein
MDADEKDDDIRGDDSALQEEVEQIKVTIKRTGILKSQRINSETNSRTHQHRAPQNKVRGDKELEELGTDLS